MGEDATDLQALERFVVDNDELLELEARIGRFNIFDALGIARAEIRHSNFLAWLLDPAESHGQGSLFLKAILMDLLKRAGEEGVPRALSPVQLDGVELQGVEVRREMDHIDLRIACREPQFVFAIENKVDGGEHSEQLSKYAAAIDRLYPEWRKQLVFLTREGEPPESDKDAKRWLPYSYADIHRVLKRCRDANQTSIGDDVLAFLDHYLNLIGTRFMDDPTIDELCQKIYKNHRAAIQLIMERAATTSSVGTNLLKEELQRSPSEWHVLSAPGNRLYFVPSQWRTWMSPLGTSHVSSLLKDRAGWMFWWFEVIEKNARGQCILRMEMGELVDPDLRRALLQALRESAVAEALQMRAQVNDRWTRFYRATVSEWPVTEEFPRANLTTHAKNALTKALPIGSAISDALRPIIAEWEAKRKAAGVE